MKKNISVNISGLSAFLPAEEIMAAGVRASVHLDALVNGTGEGNDFLGWITLPADIMNELDRIEACALRLRKTTDTTVVIGIGGSYLGSRAVMEAVGDYFSPGRSKRTHQVLFAGQNLCSDYIHELLTLLDERNYSIITVSKSGTTTEPAVAFRLLKAHLEAKVGRKAASERIVAVTDASRGALKRVATIEGYETFSIPDDVGGRYSVLTAVGLLPLAVAGADIRELVKGAADMADLTNRQHNPENNPSLVYAAARNLLLNLGKRTEIMVNYTPKLHYMAEWWKQLYGESEGKTGKGIFPASVDNTSDLHSMGQYIQEGERHLFETVLSVGKTRHSVVIPTNDGNEDNLNFLAGKTVDFINRAAEAGTQQAHIEGNVPNITVEIPELNEYYLGQLIYFFELACGISGYILGVNPFDQPGVEAYKKKMFSLLGKPV
jgi:glucose-6-phosphate isomerase